MQRNLTKGPITVNLLFFALPLMFGNLLQQLYNVADTWVVGRYLGADALAAVGSSWEAEQQSPCCMEAAKKRK